MDEDAEVVDGAGATVDGAGRTGLFSSAEERSDDEDDDSHSGRGSSLSSVERDQAEAMLAEAQKLLAGESVTKRMSNKARDDNMSGGGGGGVMKREQEEHVDGVNSVAWVQGRGRGFISSGDDGAVRIWDATSG
eukprot:2307966-Pyramimonas_sp.AAC.1